MTRPNILLIMSDEHDPGVTGCYGDTIVQTQALDRLAAEGVCFDSAYTTSPLCVPARLSFTAGKYVSRCGAWSNSCWLPSDDYPSLPRLLNARGYESLLAGKMHYDRERRYGFTDLCDCGRNRSRKDGLGQRRDPDDTTPVLESWRSRSSQFYTAETSHIMAKDGDVTSACCDFLKGRSADDKPFFLLAGYLAPHFPLIVPERYYERYRGRVPLPTIPDGYLEAMPTNYRQLRFGFGLTEIDEATVQVGRDLYWAFVDWLDDQVGLLLDALRESGVADNTIVIYTSDHGENKGDHATWWKNNMYEHSSRIPLIISRPGRWGGGQRRGGACSMVDLTQTIADLAGATCPADWDGDSLVPLLDDADVAWKDFAVSEYYAHNISSGFVMCRRGQWKYVYHTRMNESHGPERELYDLEADPAEYQNLATMAEHQDRMTAMHHAMVAELGRGPDEAEAACRRDYAVGYGIRD